MQVHRAVQDTPGDHGRTQTPNGIGAFASWFTRHYLGGQNRHDDELETGMAIGLAHIKAIAEARQDIAQYG